MRVRLESVGCRLNTAEMQGLALRLEELGHTLVGPGESADLMVVNTCAVTATAAHKSRQALHRLRRECPGAVLVATGCLAELEPAADGADRVVANRDKDRLAEVLVEGGLLAAATSPPADPRPAPGRTRAFVKVQDGCDNRCAYCVVRVARGPGRSLTPDLAVGEVRRRERLGYREVVLTGVHLGSWGRDLQPASDLAALVRRLLEETGVPRLRLSSVEPWDVGRPLLELLADPRLLPHLHLPLQSGCDATLARMARRITTSDYAALVAEARARIPGVSISTDLMVGFPGETDADFAQSLAFAERTAFSRIHVFRFSPRAGTPAATMPNQVPEAALRARSEAARALAARAEVAFNRRFLGATLPVLWESAEPCATGRLWVGLTPSYVRTVADTDAGVDLANRITPTLILDLVPGGLRGQPLLD